jgi:hypothetical protein
MKKTVEYTMVMIIWAASIALWIVLEFPWMFIGLVALHLLELIFIGLGIGRRAEISTPKIIAMCMVFGIVWWQPIKKSLAREEKGLSE